MAGINVGSAWVTIVADTKNIQRDLSKATKGAGTAAGDQFASEFESSTSKASKAASTFDARIQSMTTKATVGFLAAGTAMYGFANAAGDLDAAISASEQVLGSAADGVLEWSEASVENLGLSQRAALEAATAFGMFGKELGLQGDELAGFSTEMVTLAADMAAFANVPVSQAVDDLRAAFAGSTETLQKYNIIVNESAIKAALFDHTGQQVTGTLTAQQRILGLQYALMDKTADIQGQAAREADSFARAGDNLKATLEDTAASLGESVLPAATAFLDVVTKGVGWLGDFNEATGGFVGQAGLFATAGLGAAAAAGQLYSVVQKSQLAFAALPAPVTKASKAVGVVAAVAGVAYTVWNMLGQGHLNASGHIDTASDALIRQTAVAFDNAVAAGEASTQVDALAIANTALALAIAESADDDMTQWLANLNVAATDTLDVLNGLQTQGYDLAYSQQLLQEAFGLSATQAQLFTDTVMGFGFGEDDITQGLRDSLGWTDDQILEVRASLNGLEQYAIENTAEIDEMARAYLDAAVQMGGVSQQAVIAAEAIAGSRLEAGNATDVYEQFLIEMVKLDPAAASAALALGDIGPAATTAADGIDEMSGGLTEAEGVAADSIDVYDDLARAIDSVAENADDMREAVRRAIDPAVNLTEASEDLWAASIGFGDAIDDNSRSLDISTAAGQTNRDVVEEWADSVWAMTDAQIGNGESIGDVTAAWWRNRDALIATAREAGFTEEDINSLLTEYGLTPENLDTAIRLYGDEQAAEDLQAVLDSMDEIPPEIATDIQTDINEGSLQSARLKIEQLIRNRRVQIAIDTVRGNLARIPILRGLVPEGAHGAYVPGGSDQLWRVGEAPWDEAILTVGNMANLRKQMADSRISGPILEALDLQPAMAGGGGPGDTNHFNFYELKPTPASISYGLRMARLS